MTRRRGADPAREAPIRPTFKMLRIALLLVVLLVVALAAYRSREMSTRWRAPLYVSLYPVAGDDSPVTRAYLASLDADRFRPIDAFFVREGARYRLATDEPVRTRLRPEIGERPPRRDADASMLSTVLWSLRLRWWAWRVGGRPGEPEDIRVFVLYHDPARSPTVPHSLGITQGLIGVVYAFAAAQMSAQNDVIIAHEMLHTVGASDKYEPATDAPRFPDGFGDPRQSPLYPQRTAELMAGRRAIAPDRSEQPAGLDEVIIGAATAREIRWPTPAN